MKLQETVRSAANGKTGMLDTAVMSVIATINNNTGEAFMHGPFASQYNAKIKAARLVRAADRLHAYDDGAHSANVHSFSVETLMLLGPFLKRSIRYVVIARAYNGALASVRYQGYEKNDAVRVLERENISAKREQRDRARLITLVIR